MIKNLTDRNYATVQKRKAQKVLHEHTIKSIRCELTKSDVETIDAQDLCRIRK